MPHLPRRHRRPASRAPIEKLEGRLFLSASPAPRLFGAEHLPGIHNTASPDLTGYMPVNLRQAYGVSGITFGNIAGDGTGQTIAIIDAYDTPTIAHDLTAFDTQFGLPAPPSFKRVAQDGSTHYPPVDPASKDPGGNDWELETALDVEWAHAMAPKASILLVEATDESYSNLFSIAPNFARRQPGVSVVSMSFGDDETNYADSNSVYTTPSGHTGVTFIASSGDNGAYSAYGGTQKVVSYPASSPNVLSVGGTALNLNGSAWASETAWGYRSSTSSSFEGTGGGISAIEVQPSYQKGIVTQSTQYRTVPDVSMDGDPNTGVNVYDSFNGGASNAWTVLGGTSLSAPLWAGLIAIADQGRIINKLSTLDGATQTLPDLYKLPVSDFHDITLGNNGGYRATAGYDLCTGRGSPIANLLIPDLASVGLTPRAPTIGGLTASAGTVAQGSNLTLAASSVVAIAGHVQSVSFYRESNGVAGLQTGAGGDALVSIDSNSADGWSCTFSTSKLTPATYTFYAQALTTGGLRGATGTAAAKVGIMIVKAGTITGPVIASLSASTTTISSSGTPLLLTANRVADAVGVTITKVEFYLEYNGIVGLQTDSTTGDFLDFTATPGSRGWTDAVSPASEFDPQSGVYTFYAIAYDNRGEVSAPVAVQVSYRAGSIAAPAIGAFKSSATTVAPGATVTLTAGKFTDPNNTPAFVSFYRESNSIAGLQADGASPDALLGTNITAADPSTLIIKAPLTPGTYTYYAQLTDDYGVSSAIGTSAIKITITVT